MERSDACVRKVALQLGAIVVAKLGDALPRKNRLGEAKVGHVGAAERAVDGEEAQPRQLEPVQLVGEMGGERGGCYSGVGVGLCTR